VAKADLRELIEHVRKATGPDRQLGRNIYLALGWQRARYEIDDSMAFWVSPDGRTSFQDGDFHLRDPTGSLDVITSWIERELPELCWSASKGPAEARVYSFRLFRPETGRVVAEFTHEDECLGRVGAYLIAVLEMRQEEEGNEVLPTRARH